MIQQITIAAVLAGVASAAVADVYRRIDADLHLPRWVDVGAGLAVALLCACIGYWLADDLSALGPRLTAAISASASIVGGALHPSIMTRLRRGVAEAKVPGQ
jgi:uncharacterized membrane protein